MSQEKKASGFLLVDKPSGASSFRAIGKIKRFFKPLKVGFAGTLDPDATGLLVVGIGRGTRLMSYIESDRKVYEFDMVPGITTDTYDTSGEVLSRSDYSQITEAQLKKVMDGFMGCIDQMPPVYSAIKVKGKRACDRVRAGEEVQLKSRPVTIYSLKLLNWGKEQWRFELVCSKGTYVRSLVHDMGQQLGCGATTANIRRTSIGTLSVNGALKGEVEDYTPHLMPLEIALKDLPQITLTDQEGLDFLHGKKITLPEKRLTDLPETANEIKLYSESGDLLALGRVDEEGLLRPRIVLEDPEYYLNKLPQ